MSRHKKGRIPPGPVVRAASAPQRWWTSKGPVVRFGASFVGFAALFSAISLAPFFQSFLAGYLQFDVRLADKALNWLGQETHSTGDTIISSRFAVTVLSECSASEFIIFLWAGLLAFPTTLRNKVLGIVLGTLGVVFVNLVRIVTLFLIGVYRPRLFATVHEELWPGLFIIATILFAAGWASWATRKEHSHAPA